MIALRYMLSDSWYKEFKKELKVLIDKYLNKHDSISEQELYEKMSPDSLTKSFSVSNYQGTFSLFFRF